MKLKTGILTNARYFYMPAPRRWHLLFIRHIILKRLGAASFQNSPLIFYRRPNRRHRDSFCYTRLAKPTNTDEAAENFISIYSLAYFLIKVNQKRPFWDAFDALLPLT